MAAQKNPEQYDSGNAALFIAKQKAATPPAKTEKLTPDPLMGRKPPKRARESKPLLRIWIRLDLIGNDARSDGYRVMNRALDLGLLQDSINVCRGDLGLDITVKNVVCATDPDDLRGGK